MIEDWGKFAGNIGVSGENMESVGKLYSFRLTKNWKYLSDVYFIYSSYCIPYDKRLEILWKGERLCY